MGFRRGNFTVSVKRRPFSDPNVSREPVPKSHLRDMTRVNCHTSSDRCQHHCRRSFPESCAVVAAELDTEDPARAKILARPDICHRCFGRERKIDRASKAVRRAEAHFDPAPLRGPLLSGRPRRGLSRRVGPDRPRSARRGSRRVGRRRASGARDSERGDANGRLSATLSTRR